MFDEGRGYSASAMGKTMAAFVFMQYCASQKRGLMIVGIDWSGPNARETLVKSISMIAATT